MENVLIPLVVVLLMGLIVVVLMRLAPAHQKEMNTVFEEFSMRHGVRHLGEDDGRARKFAAHFDGIGGFPAESMPRDVVDGVVDGQRMILFRHGPGTSGASAEEWYVAGLELKRAVAERCSVQFCRRPSDSESDHLTDPVAMEREIGDFNVVVRAPDASSAGRLLEEQALGELAALAGKLPFRPELQVRGNRIIACPADHGTTIEYTNDLDALMWLAKRAASFAPGRS